MLNEIKWFFLSLSDAKKGWKHGYSGAYADGLNDGKIAGYQTGYDSGKKDAQREMLDKLAKHDPKLDNPAFTLGFAQALAIVRGDVK